MADLCYSRLKFTLCFDFSRGLWVPFNIDSFRVILGVSLCSNFLLEDAFSYEEWLLSLLGSRLLMIKLPSILSCLWNPESFLWNLMFSDFLSRIDPVHLRLLLLPHLASLSIFVSSWTYPKLISLSETSIDFRINLPSILLIESADMRFASWGLQFSDELCVVSRRMLRRGFAEEYIFGVISENSRLSYLWRV